MADAARAALRRRRQRRRRPKASCSRGADRGRPDSHRARRPRGGRARAPPRRGRGAHARGERIGSSRRPRRRCPASSPRRAPPCARPSSRASSSSPPMPTGSAASCGSIDARADRARDGCRAPPHAHDRPHRTPARSPRPRAGRRAHGAAAAPRSTHGAARHARGRTQRDRPRRGIRRPTHAPAPTRGRAWSRRSASSPPPVRRRIRWRRWMPRGARCGMPRTPRRSPTTIGPPGTESRGVAAIVNAMTDVQTRPRHPVLRVVARIPATLSLVAALLVVGVVFAGLWSPFEDSPLFDDGRLRPARAPRGALVDAGHGHVLRRPPARVPLHDRELRGHGLPRVPPRLARGPRLLRRRTAVRDLRQRAAAVAFRDAAVAVGAGRGAGAGRRPVGRHDGVHRRGGGSARRSVARARMGRAARLHRRHAVLLGLARRPRARPRGRLVLVRRPVAAHPAHHAARAATHRVRQHPRPRSRSRSSPSSSRPTARSVTPTRPTVRSSTSPSTW